MVIQVYYIQIVLISKENVQCIESCLMIRMTHGTKYPIITRKLFFQVLTPNDKSMYFYMIYDEM